MLTLIICVNRADAKGFPRALKLLCGGAGRRRLRYPRETFINDLFTISSIPVALLILIIGCTPPENNRETAIQYPPLNNNLSPGELAQAYCGSCHLYPEPSLLPRSVWEQELLKNMARRLGVTQDGYDPFRQLSMYDAFILRYHNIYPEDSLISKDDWRKIVDFYLDKAPAGIQPQQENAQITQGLAHFKVKVINDLPAQPLSTLVKIDTGVHQIYWGSRTADLMITDQQGKLMRQHQLDSPPSDILLSEFEHYVLTMGIMDPSEESKGSLKTLVGRQTSNLLQQLQRPVQVTKADLDSDGLDDFVVAHFGNQTGKLSWYKNNGQNSFQEYILKNTPGALQTYVLDMNGDGSLEIVALFGQGDEGISIFSRKNSGSFEERRVLRFPPVYGSSSFQLVDFNGDDQWDILYSNGDNADYSFTLKPYHGTRIYLNRGNYQFEEAFFYPMYGTTKSVARDFDQDGDLDIFAIAFFPDFKAQFPEGFVYLENQGDLSFKPYTFPESVNGRWLVADTGDLDDDGDIDIVLGSLLFRTESAPRELLDRWSTNGYQMVILENTINN